MKRFTAIFLAMLLSMAPASMTACSGGQVETQNENTTTPAEQENTEQTEETEETAYTADVPESDFNGYEFRVLARSEEIGKFWHKDLYVEELTGDVFNDSIIHRNEAVAEQLNVVISPVWTTDIVATASNSIMAADNAFDTVFGHTKAMQSLFTKDLLADLHTIPHMDFSKPWWDQNSVKDLSLGDSLYYVYGDFTICDEEATWIVYFNKEIQKNLQMEDLYTLVQDGKWTNDKFHELSQVATYDSDGDGALTTADMYGYLGEAYNITVSLIGNDILVVDRNENNGLAMLESTERFFSAYEKIMTFMNDANATLISNRKGENFDDLTRLAKFQNGEALFMMCGMVNITVFRDLVADFGLLPIPKYDEAQEEYYTTLSFLNGPGLCLPKTLDNPERTGIILETYSAESKNILIPAYYDISLKRKATRDEESAAMLDIIIAGRRYDLGTLLNVGGIYDKLNALVFDKATEIASTYASISKAMQNAIEQYNEDYIHE